MSESHRQRQHDPLAAKFATPDDRRQYFADLGRASNAGRVILTHEETRALGQAYDLLGRIAQRHGEKLTRSSVPSDQDAA
jgi:hypothetical protein